MSEEKARKRHTIFAVIEKAAGHRIVSQAESPQNRVGRVAVQHIGEIGQVRHAIRIQEHFEQEWQARTRVGRMQPLELIVVQIDRGHIADNGWHKS